MNFRLQKSGNTEKRGQRKSPRGVDVIGHIGGLFLGLLLEEMLAVRGFTGPTGDSSDRKKSIALFEENRIKENPLLRLG